MAEKEAPIKKEQQEIVIAPAGCGKTTNMSKDIKEYLDEQGEEGIKKLLCLTFTNRAEKEMQDATLKRLKKEELTPEGRKVDIAPEEVRKQISTLHSFCLSILYAENIISHETRIIDPPSALGKKIAEKLRRISKSSKDKDSLLIYTQYIAFCSKIQKEFPEYKLKHIKPGLIKTYRTLKKEEEAIDYGDILILFYKYQKEHPESKKYKLVLVDEAQDLNSLELEICKNLVDKEHGRITFFMDPRQSIYSFQGASMNSLQRLVNESDERKQNWPNKRSSKNIVNLLNEYQRIRLYKSDLSVFKLRKQVSSKRKTTQYDCKKWLSFIYASTRLQERKEIVEFIKQLPSSEECAILTRTNKSAKEIISDLTKLNQFFVFNPKIIISKHWRFLEILKNHIDVCFDPKNEKAWEKLISSLRPSPSFISYGNHDRYSEMSEIKIKASDLVFYERGGLATNFIEAVIYKQQYIFVIIKENVEKKFEISTSGPKTERNVLLFSKESLISLLKSIPKTITVVLYYPDEISTIVEDINYQEFIDFNDIIALLDDEWQEDSVGEESVIEAAQRLLKYQFRQEQFYKRESTKKTRRLMYERYKPIYDLHRRTLKMIPDNPEQCRDVLDWLKAAIAKLSQNGLMGEPLWALLETVKGEIAHKMKNWAEVQNEKEVTKRQYIEQLSKTISELEINDIVKKADFVKYTHNKIRKVYIMTVHQAKGQSFDNVIMYNSTHREYNQGEEDERVFYVGLSRARRRILITYSDTYNTQKKSPVIHWPCPLLSTDDSGRREPDWVTQLNDNRHYIEGLVKEMIKEVNTTSLSFDEETPKKNPSFHGKVQIGEIYEMTGTIRKNGEHIQSLWLSVL